MRDKVYEFIRANGVRLHVALAGSQDGEPLILLHGFPDASFGWDQQIRVLAKAGFFVIAPDQRGYNLSEKPEGKENYNLNLLAADVLALADALGLQQFNLAGHDFGAAVSWTLAGQHPGRVKRLAIINVPHPAVMSAYLKENKQQRRKSEYIFFFRLPVIPELVLRAFDWKMLAANMSPACSKADLDRYKEAWSQPGAITAMLNWYRSLFPLVSGGTSANKIAAPTLIIWGKQDPYLMWQMAPASAALCEDGRLEYIENSGHWVHQEKPVLVNQMLLRHF